MNVSFLLSVSINTLKLIQISNVLQFGAVLCVVAAQAHTIEVKSEASVLQLSV
jgi:hypothetical protein